jgi:predicted secreted protein
MAEVAGKNGKVAVGDATAEIGFNGWALDQQADALDTTTFDDSGWRTFLAGLKSWSGTMGAFFQDASDPSQTALIVGTIVAIRLYLDSGDYFSGNALINNNSPAVGVADINTSGYTFQGTGALSFTAA